MKLNRKFASVLLAGAMVAGIMAMPAGAEGEAPSGNAQITKVLNFVDSDDDATDDCSVPSVTFNYTVSCIDNTKTEGEVYKAATTTTPEILNGVGTGSATINFNSDTQKDSDGTSATQTASVTWINANYTKPGIYRYKVVESVNGTIPADLENNSDTEFVLDVYVVNATDEDDNPTFSVANYVLLKNESDPSTSGVYSVANKAENFDATYKTYSLSLQKHVDGTMGDKTRYFEFTITFSDVPNGMTFTQGNATIAKGENDTYSVTVSLKDGDSMTSITGIPSTVKYTITENLDTKEGYSTSYRITSGTTLNDAVSGTATGVQTMDKNDVTVAFTNTKNAATPTGLLMDVAPYAAMIVLAAAAAFVFLRRRSANED